MNLRTFECVHCLACSDNCSESTWYRFFITSHDCLDLVGELATEDPRQSAPYFDETGRSSHRSASLFEVFHFRFVECRYAFVAALQLDLCPSCRMPSPSLMFKSCWPSTAKKPLKKREERWKKCRKTKRNQKREQCASIFAQKYAISGVHTTQRVPQ